MVAHERSILSQRPRQSMAITGNGPELAHQGDPAFRIDGGRVMPQGHESRGRGETCEEGAQTA
jgi:hypothetical protein